MKNHSIALIFSLCLAFQLNAQIDVQPNNIGINTSGQLSELSINGIGFNNVTAYIESVDNVSGSTALYAKAFDISAFGGFTTAIAGEADHGNNSSFSYGVRGRSLRSSPSSNGRAFGVHGVAGNATNGANYGIFGDLQGSQFGSAVVGYDRVGNPGWSELTPNSISYAGYFHGKGYFHDNVGIGESDPQASLHIDSGDVYIEDAASGIILSNGTDCYRVTVDALGNLVTALLPTCP